jgi:hypothetical protein
METFLKEQRSSRTCLYPLEIQAIPLNERIIPELDCLFIHKTSQRAVCSAAPKAVSEAAPKATAGQFTTVQALYIQTITGQWNWQVDKSNSPACPKNLVRLPEQLCGRASEEKEVGL